jgi:CSLREA domain-containing protein
MNSSFRRRILLALSGLALAALACTLDDLLIPKTFYVTKTLDTADGECSVDDCSLREAVIAANESLGRNEIVVPPGFYLLTITGSDHPLNPAGTGDLDFTGSALIHGAPKMEPPVIDGGTGDRIFDVHEGFRVEMSEMRLQNGAALDGGAIYTQGELVLSDVDIRDSVAHAYGGGIYNGGSLTIQDVTVTGNTSDKDGGGIANVFGTLLANLEGPSRSPGGVYGNSAAEEGGGIYNYGGRIELAGRMIVNANSASTGGGIYNAGVMKLTGIQIADNQASIGGGIFTAWSAETDSAEAMRIDVRQNSATVGAGILDANSTLRLENSSVANNTAGSFGSGMYLGPFGESDAGCRDQGDLTNVTFTGNAGVEGLAGAIFVDCGVELTNVTIASNPAGGIIGGGPTIHLARLKNVLLSDNAGFNCSGASIDSLGHNLENGDSCGLSGPLDQPGVDPLLGSLLEFADPGGASPNMFIFPLLAGSLAINTGDNVGCPATDQRGAARPFASLCDIGAYEFGSPDPLPRIVPTDLTLTLVFPPTDPLTSIPIQTSTPSPTLPVLVVPSTTNTRHPSDTPEPEVFITDTPTATQGLIIVTLAPLLPSSTPIP